MTNYYQDFIAHYNKKINESIENLTYFDESEIQKLRILNRYDDAMYLLILSKWIKKTYKIYYKNCGYEAITDNFVLISHFPLKEITRILLYHGYYYCIWFDNEMRIDIAKYVYTMWKTYKLVDDAIEGTAEFKTTFKMCKDLIKNSIMKVTSIETKKEYCKFIKFNCDNYDPLFFGSCSSKYYQYHLYIYIPLLPDSATLVTKLLDIAFLDDAQEFLLYGLLRLDPNALFTVTKNMILQLINQAKLPTKVNKLSCLYRNQSFDPFRGSSPGPWILESIIKQLYENKLYLLNDDDIIKACNEKYGDDFPNEDIIFGKLVKNNEETYRSMYLECKVCKCDFIYSKDEDKIYVNLKKNKYEFKINAQCQKCKGVICSDCIYTCFHCIAGNR
jgi:hypothetical protein